MPNTPSRLAGSAKAGAPAKPLWTEKEFGDFVLIADWRLTDKNAKLDGLSDGNSAAGICLRGSEKPLVTFSRGKPTDWNRFVVTVKGGGYFFLPSLAALERIGEAS